MTGLLNRIEEILNLFIRKKWKKEETEVQRNKKIPSQTPAKLACPWKAKLQGMAFVGNDIYFLIGEGAPGLLYITLAL